MGQSLKSSGLMNAVKEIQTKEFQTRSPRKLGSWMVFQRSWKSLKYVGRCIFLNKGSKVLNQTITEIRNTLPLKKSVKKF